MCRFVSSCKCVVKDPGEECELRKCVALLGRVSMLGRTRAKTMSSVSVSLC